MPGTNSRKIYVKDGHYHVYNRGVEKREIFKDPQDYKVLLKYLKEGLSPPPSLQTLKTTFTLQGQAFKGVPRQPKNYHDKVELLAFCLMPNHFHLLVKIKDSDALKTFMQSLQVRYSMYFNKKYDRVGSLFQDRYKAVLITEENYLLHLSRYIHLNPSEYTGDLIHAYSSYADYLGLKKTSWIKPDMILSFFNQATLPELKKVNSYKDFVEEYKKDSAKILGEITLD